MKNKTYTKIESKIERLENQRAADIERCKEIIAVHEAKIKEVGKRITANMDIDDFLIASEDRTKSEATIKACKDKIRLLETEGMMSDAEYEADVESVRAEQHKLVDDAFDAIVPLMKQMFKLFNDMDEKVIMFNDLLKADADISKHDLGPVRIVTFNDDKYDLLKGHIGKLQYNMQHHIKLADAFKE